MVYVVLPLVVLLLAAAALVAWKWRQVMQPPARAPERWSDSLRPESGPVLLCLGDSITHGHLGSDWTELLAERGLAVVNGGINGELAWNVVRRVERALGCRPDAVTVLIGANDAMAAHDEASGRRYMKMVDLPRLPDLEWFEENLRELVRCLREGSQARIALMTLAPIAEDGSAPIALLVAECNAIIARVALDLGVGLLPLHDRLTALLGPSQGDPRLTYRPGLRSRTQMVGAGILHYLAGMSWDQIAARRGMSLTVDLVHLNDRAGAVVAELVEGFARQEESAS